MRCITCKEEMVILELEGVEIDYCYGCRGIWLDKGELEELLADKEQGDALLNSIQSAGEVKEKKRKCPICKKKMEKISMKVKNKFILDRCLAHGIWFDKGELDGILDEISEKSKKSSKLSLVLNDIFRKNKSEGG